MKVNRLPVVPPSEDRSSRVIVNHEILLVASRRDGGIIVGGDFLSVAVCALGGRSTNTPPQPPIARRLAGKQLLGLSGLHINGSN